MTALSQTMLDDSPGVQSLTGDEIERLYPVVEKHSPEGERLGRIPYTDLYFCALGTALVRLTHGFSAPVQGNCARLRQHPLARHLRRGRPRGIAIDPPYRGLQRFIVDQRVLGLLLTMVSISRPPEQ